MCGSAQPGPASALLRAAWRADHAVALQRHGGWLDVLANTDSHLAVLMGQPLNEPVVCHGPFAMSSAADNERAARDYQAGRMGALAPL
jgi:quercetin 2,3-dioxygenase